MRRPTLPYPWSWLAALALAGVACGDSGGGGRGRPVPPEPATAARPGGDTTVPITSDDVFSQPAANLTPERSDAFFVGNAFFKTNWVTAPASAEGRDGLGPLFNARSCSACHLLDGRGRPPEPGEDAVALLFRIGTGGIDAAGAPLPDPTYGGQLQGFAVLGVPSEPAVAIAYEEVAGTYGDGTPYTLLAPSYSGGPGTEGPLADDVRLSPRVAPQVFGMGLLEAVPEDAVLARADPDDVDGDGISGRANRVVDRRLGGVTLGRLGWKAEQPTVEQQAAGAFRDDVGITTSLFPEQPCTAAQTACLAAPDGGAPEADDDLLAHLTFYMQTLGVPERRRPADPVVQRGRQVFHELGCESCHAETLVTRADFGVPELAGQTIHPFTDLLLHDMGPELADDRPAFAADGREWRTPPLWGLGLVPRVNGHDRLLHDGRARGFAEAILWHGGEARDARDAFLLRDAAARAALVAFLEDL